MMADMWGAEM